MSNPYAPPPAGPQRPPSREDAPARTGQGDEPPEAREAGDRGAARPEPGTRPPAGPLPPAGPATGARPALPPARPGTGAARPPLPPPPPDPEAVLRVGRLVRHFGVWLLAGVAVSLLPLPWRVATVAFLAGAVVTGIRALRAVAVARMRGGLLPLLVAGLALTGLLGAGTLGSFALWPAETARQECLSGALTVSAQAACDRAYEDALDDLTGGITGGP